ncbi:MAG: site-specific integrase [Proteobacteria bacterium]|nr:site-specific integrase [Pseudomonadota bacterium]
MNKKQSPLPLFDSLDHIKNWTSPKTLNADQEKDFFAGVSFLKNYTGSQGTFNSYRREVERLLQWGIHIADKSFKQMKREDIEAFVHFCQSPPKAWIGVKKAPRFFDKEGMRTPNPEWRPFVLTVSKAAHRKGERPDSQNFELSLGSTKEIFSILSTFFNYLLQDDYVFMNPVALIRQKSKFIRKHQGAPKIRRLSELQWQYVIKMAHQLAAVDPETHERTLFMMSILYMMYLRISELAASTRWMPSMNHFHRDSEGNWWFTTVGKGNKERQIAVSNATLDALKRWRTYLGFSPLPSPADTSPLLSKIKGRGPITSTTYVRKIVQYCFDQSIDQLNKEGLTEEADSLSEATVHWLRHTGISDDVKRRPREHVRDDAGHSSSVITDKYIDIELKERHRSARNKPLFVEG